MTTQELYELASLDALGLLDDDERADFERAFRAAAPEVQAQIRRQQLHAADIEDLLPRVEPPAGLRARVLEAVRQAMSVVRPAHMSHAQDSGVLAKIYTSMPLWRAACIGFATATVVLSLFFVWVAQENQRIAARWENAETLAELQQNLGPRGMDLISRVTTTQVEFAPAAADIELDEPLVARLFLDPETGEALLVCKGLPISDRNYRLVIDTGSDTNQSIQEFPSDGEYITVVVNGIEADNVDRIAIVGPTSEQGPEGVLLRVKDV